MTANGRSKDTKKKKKMCTQASDLKERLESCVQRLENQNPHIQTIAVDELRNLAREITEECEERKLSSSQQSEEADLDDLKILVAQVVPFYMKHNAEVEAVDLATEVEDFDLLIDNVNIRNYKRMTMYLTCLARYLPVPDNTVALHVARAIYLKYDDHPSALRISLCLNHLEYVKQLFEKCEDVSQKKQFCYMLARHGTNVLLDEKMVADDDERAEMQQIIRNSKLRGGYLDLAHETEVRDPKSPEEIFEAQLINGWENGGARTEIARQNLAATFVNAFVNAGFGRDMLIIVPPEGPSGASTEDWILLNKNHEQTSAAASLGMILLWDVDGLPQFDRYLLKGNYLTAGVLLGHGILNAAISDDFDPASLLAHYARLEDLVPRIGAIMGLGIAYAGSRDVQILEMFMPILGDSCTQHAVIAFIAVSLGLIFVGSSNEIIAGLLISRLADLTEDELSEPLTRFVVLGLGLLFLGKQGHIGATATDCKHFSEKIFRGDPDILCICWDWRCQRGAKSSATMYRTSRGCNPSGGCCTGDCYGSRGRGS